MKHLLVTMILLASGMAYAQSKTQLRIEKFRAPQKSFYVLSTLIMGEKECILFDGQYKVSDGKRLAEKIRATGKDLKAIIISHADHDHYMGATEIVKTFPGTPVYMIPSSLTDFRNRSGKDLAYENRKGPNPEAPKVLIKPKRLPSDTLMLEGRQLILVKDLVGDVKEPMSAARWIPSLKTMLTGDLVFDGIHPWMGFTDISSRKEWIKSLRRLAEFNAVRVVPGHKKEVNSPDSPDQIDFMIRYLEYYDEQMSLAGNPKELISKMKRKYPELELSFLMEYGARNNFKK